MKRIFTVGASTIPGEYIVPRLLSEIIRQLPDLELKVDILDSMKVFEKVKKSDIEIGVIGTKYDSPDVDFVTVVKDDRLVFITPAGHPLSGKKGATINDLKGQSFVGRELGSGTRAAYEKALKDAGLSIDDLNVVAEISDTSGIIQAVEGGAGISVVSELAAKEAIELKRVSVLDIPMLKMKRDFYVITRKGAPLSKDAASVLSLIKTTLH
jgi:DNA-binding transcriptional LysR family regulator